LLVHCAHSEQRLMPVSSQTAVVWIAFWLRGDTHSFLNIELLKYLLITEYGN